MSHSRRSYSRSPVARGDARSRSPVARGAGRFPRRYPSRPVRLVVVTHPFSLPGRSFIHVTHAMLVTLVTLRL